MTDHYPWEVQERHEMQAEREDAIMAENAKLREQIERLQPKDCEGNALDIADTVSMLRSEYDGDHEWDDVVVELALTKWGGDRWIVRGSKGEAWACDCLKTGYDEDAYEGSDDAEPIVNPSLIEVENAKLRHDFSDACVRFFNASRDCERLQNDLAILTHKHECLISAVTHGLVSKVQTPNEEVELLVREYWERERQEVEDENERLKGRLDILEDPDQYVKTALAEVGCDECGEYKQEAYRLFKEVVKLRELVSDMGKMLTLASWTSVENDEQSSQCIYRAEALGIEVDL